MNRDDILIFEILHTTLKSVSQKYKIDINKIIITSENNGNKISFYKKENNNLILIEEINRNFY